jgi:hypothetical protein
MKRYTIGLITGALLAISAIMFIGAVNNEDSAKGRYQFMAPVLSTPLMLDTRDATLYYYKIEGMTIKSPGGQWRRISAQEPFK